MPWMMLESTFPMARPSSAGMTITTTADEDSDPRMLHCPRRHIRFETIGSWTEGRAWPCLSP